MIDLHCHLLPGIDDGPRDMAAAVAIAARQVELGVRAVAATPHVSWEHPNDAATIVEGVGRMRTELAARGIALEVVTGAEIDVERAAELDDDALRPLTLGGGPWLLLEAPLQRNLPLEPVAFALMERGHRVVVAHPERSPALQRDPAAVRRLADAGVLMQVTASALVGRFGRTVQRYAEQLLDAGLLHTVGSDAHDAQRRAPGMREPLVAAGLGDLVELLCEEVPAAILAGDSIPAAPRRHAAGRRLRALLRRG